MRKLTLVVSVLFASGLMANAQPWLDNTSTSPQKLQDIVEKYKAMNATDDEKKEAYEQGKPVQEGKSYHFDRWVWYWERHLDENGYMVSPLKTFDEWNKWKAESARAQSKTTNASNWTFRGPDRSPGGYYGIGRINVIAFHPTDTNTFWIGSGGGGAWKTTNNGLNWTVINDFLPVLGVSDIDFNPQNPNTIYLCTGDRDASDTYSVGVLKSSDGGATWDTTGLKWDRTAFMLANSLVINPLDTNSLTLATNTGIFKSFDAGVTWTSMQKGSFKQVLYNPADTNVLYAAGVTTSTNQVFRSVDGGSTWLPSSTFPNNGRVEMAVTAADPKIVKAVVANSSNGLLGVYNSVDSGATFTQIFNDGTNCSTNILASSPKGDKCGGQGWYDLTIAISPVDKNEVVIGGVNTWFSSDGGATWNNANQWTSSVPGITVVHADKHFHLYHPLKPTTLFECNDGGVYFTTDATGKFWNDISNGLGITQFYRNSVSGNASFVIGGSQDNGTKKLDNGVYTELTGGDGMDNQIDYSDAKVFYTSQQYGELRRTINGGSSFTDISNKIPGGQPTGAWVTPILIDPKVPTTIFAGFDKLYMSEDRGDSWESITTVTFGNKIQRIARGNNDTHIYFLANNRIYISRDYGKTWESRASSLAGTISDITVDPYDADHIWVTFNGYNSTRVAEYTPANGWKAHNQQLPNVPVNCIAIDPADARLYIGTDVGVFVKHPTETDWLPYNNSLPTVEVIDLGINNTTGEIWAATYGRGMWKSSTESFPLNVTSVPYATDVITIAPNPNNGHFTIQTSNAAIKGNQVTVYITGMNGATVWQQDVQVNGNGTVSVNTELAKGMYIVNVQAGNMTIARSKMIVY